MIPATRVTVANAIAGGSRQPVRASPWVFLGPPPRPCVACQTMPGTDFVWLTHQIACTPWVKREIAEKRPDLRFAFSRPGLTTYKVTGNTTANLPAPSVFARAWGNSLGRATTVEEVCQFLSQLSTHDVRLHVFERDIAVPVDEQDPEVRGTRAAALRAELLACEPRFLREEKANQGDVVLDVIVPHASHPDEAWHIGYHVHGPAHGGEAGGVQHVKLPDEAPSRAWCKIEEAIRWGDLQILARQRAIELGSSPGGATYSLLTRGLDVYGVDPGEMHERVMNFRGPHENRFVHLQVAAAAVEKRSLPRTYEWLLCDVNLAPMVALRYVERFVALAHGGLKGAVITLKLNDKGIYEAIPSLAQRIEKLGAKTVRYTQLPSHRNELAAILLW